MNFKLLAIRPLKNCGEKILKNLEINRIYKFYDNYEFYNEENLIDQQGKIEISPEKISRINEIEKLPDNFFSRKINISAIVGKNGSGKSSLIDLFVGAINQVSIQLKEKGNLNTIAELLSTGLEKERTIHCDFFYQLDSDFYQIEIQDQEIIFNKIGSSEPIEFETKDFFYSVLLSYSVFAFNSWEIGDWVENLFHKNDAYQIPIVINPKRESKTDYLAGIIDINNENYLLKQRLISLIINDNQFNITNNLKTNYLELNWKPAKSVFAYDSHSGTQNAIPLDDEEKIRKGFYKALDTNFGIYFNINHVKQSNYHYTGLSTVLTKFKNGFKINNIDLGSLVYKIDNYILYKIVTICERYPSYKRFILKSGEYHTIDIDGFIRKVKASHSHVVLKLLQLVNFVANYDSIWKKHIEKNEIRISIAELSRDIKKHEKSVPIIELLPPAIFDIHFLSKDRVNILESISSGERQLIHIISTILYHLSNLNSVESDKGLQKYRFVNIILDEIELYFHPEFQKQFIKRLIDEINKIRIPDLIGLNMLFISHSPFILSDIPKQNVLFLDKGKPVSLEKYKNTNTFAANISSLLSDTFFIGDGLIGKFAEVKITETIKWLNSMKIEQLKTNQIEYDRLFAKKEYHKKIIEIIDEPIIKNKLLEMYSEIFGPDNKIEYLERERDRIEIELKKLKNRSI